jgi:DNA-binding transcriptional ArsR family regulator
MNNASHAAARDSLGETLVALADPMRRRVVKMLQERPRRAGEIAAAFEISGPAVSKHLRVLRRSRLIVESGDASDARIRIYRLQPEPFVELGDWVAGIRGFWTDQLESFKQLATMHAATPAASSTLVRSSKRSTAKRKAPKSRSRKQ